MSGLSAAAARSLGSAGRRKRSYPETWRIAASAEPCCASARCQSSPRIRSACPSRVSGSPDLFLASRAPRRRCAARKRSASACWPRPPAVQRGTVAPERLCQQADSPPFQHQRGGLLLAYADQGKAAWRGHAVGRAQPRFFVLPAESGSRTACQRPPRRGSRPRQRLANPPRPHASGPTPGGRQRMLRLGVSAVVHARRKFVSASAAASRSWLARSASIPASVPARCAIPSCRAWRGRGIPGPGQEGA